MPVLVHFAFCRGFVEKNDHERTKEMMRRFRNLRKGILGALVIASFCVPQVLIAQPDTLWTRTFGGSGAEQGHCVQQTSDGGYIIVGWTNSFGSGKGDVWLIKTDMNGDTLWTRIFGGNGDDCAYFVRQTQDGGYILTGNTDSYGPGGYDLWLIRTDAIGDTLCTKTIGGSGGECGYCVRETLDSGYIIVGSTGSFGADQCDIWLIKTDMNGDTLWTKTFDGFPSPDVDVGYWVEEVSDSGYIIAASKGYCWSSYSWLIKTDRNGDTLWTISGELASEIYSVQETFDGGYIATGIVYHDAIVPYSEVLLVRTDKNGDGWEKTFMEDQYGSNGGCGVTQASDSSYIIVGTTCPNDTGSLDILLAKIDTAGVLMWSETFGGSENEYGQFVQQTSDGGYIVLGTTHSFGAGQGDIWLIKLGGTGVEEESKAISLRSGMDIWPNPFAKNTTITYAVPSKEKVSLNLYDVSGRCVRPIVNAEKRPGCHSVTVDAKGLGTGLYFARFIAGDHKEVKKLIVTR
jgi:hypothetical protein